MVYGGILLVLWFFGGESEKSPACCVTCSLAKEPMQPSRRQFGPPWTSPWSSLGFSFELEALQAAFAYLYVGNKAICPLDARTACSEFHYTFRVVSHTLFSLSAFHQQLHTFGTKSHTTVYPLLHPFAFYCFSRVFAHFSADCVLHSQINWTSFWILLHLLRGYTYKKCEGKLDSLRRKRALHNLGKWIGKTPWTSSTRADFEDNEKICINISQPLYKTLPYLSKKSQLFRYQVSW